jgi:linoleoyl-CoA desaturase
VSAGMFDLLGASSYLWRYKHVVLHHTFTNVEGVDDDINMGFMGRLAPIQRRRAFHRFQHMYLWLLYPWMGLKWFLVDDFVALIKGSVGAQKVPRPKNWDLTWLILGKVLHFSVILFIPMYVAGVGATLIFYFVAQMTLGFVAAVTFQLAHCVEEAQFVNPAHASEEPVDFAMHQLATTVDFMPGSRLVNWYVGGLNHQTIHHLFPTIAHQHYPALSKVIADTCREFGVEYKVSKTLWAALRSHYRWLRRMGQPVA